MLCTRILHSRPICPECFKEPNESDARAMNKFALATMSQTPRKLLKWAAFQQFDRPSLNASNDAH